jgi:hypothetical protein
LALVLFGGDLAGAMDAVALLACCALGAVTLLQPAALCSAPRDTRRG